MPRVPDSKAALFPDTVFLPVPLTVLFTDASTEQHPIHTVALGRALDRHEARLHQSHAGSFRGRQ